jgi:predicted transcriptional regulator of viral defense system
MDPTCCTRCHESESAQIVLVLDARLCRECTKDLKRFLKRRSYMSTRRRDAQLAQMVDAHGSITILRFAKETKRTVQQAKGVLYYLVKTGRVQRVSKGRYVLPASRQAAE